MENPDTITFVASTGDEDRAGDIIDQQGWDLEHYQKNPVVLLSHQWHLPPVGQALKTWVATGRLMATVRFAPTPIGRELALLTADGYLRAVSVGFRPIEWEVRRDPKTGSALGAHFHRQELLEISVVSLPANPEALRKLCPTPVQGVSESTDDTVGPNPQPPSLPGKGARGLGRGGTGGTGLGFIWTAAPVAIRDPTVSVSLAALQALKKSLKQPSAISYLPPFGDRWGLTAES